MARLIESKSIAARKRNILYLVEKYLSDSGLESSAGSLRKEANLQPEYVVCDNIDLDSVYLEFVTYFHLKFGKYPDIIRHVDKPEAKVVISRKAPQKEKGVVLNTSNNVAPNPLTESLQVLQCNSNHEMLAQIPFDVKMNIGMEKHSVEWQDLAATVCRDLVKKDFGLKWSDIYGNRNAISTIKEAVLLPLQHPQLFTETIKPWKSVLLHGPPGTGKTLIAKALCSEIFQNMTFFNVCASTIISKWRGESEKIIRVLFDVAKIYSPSVIYIDEVEGLTSKRDSNSDHEASKRFKNEFLTLLDGLEDHGTKIFLLGSTNMPWLIDSAFLRRFERRILIEMPNTEERSRMIQHFLPESNFKQNELQRLAKGCSGFTGDEIRISCKEATMKQLRLMCENKKEIKNVKKVTEADVLQAFNQISPNTELFQRHIEWSNIYGTKY